MGKDKLKKWAENKTFHHVFEPDLLPIIRNGKTFMQNEWHRFFGNSNPITIELGCGKGEYTVGLARRYPKRNFIGVDVKGHRFHKGARESHTEGLKNVAFLRTRVEFIDSFFGENEVDEIWLTFSDPQPKDEKGNRRITSLWYLENKYRKFLRKGGLVHLKHDNPVVYDLMLEELSGTMYPIELHHDNIYSKWQERLEQEERDTLNIRTYYEQMWLEEGRKIHYIRFRTR
ncbi:MAG: hypothetical protein RL220_2115 [Bacteroidota bacterium]